MHLGSPYLKRLCFFPGLLLSSRFHQRKVESVRLIVTSSAKALPPHMDHLVHCPVSGGWTPQQNTSPEPLGKLASVATITNSIVLSSAPANKAINYGPLSWPPVAAAAINVKPLIACSQGEEADAIKINGSPSRTLPVRQQQALPSNDHHADCVCLATFIWPASAVGEGIPLSNYFYLITSICLYWLTSCRQISIKLQMPSETDFLSRCPPPRDTHTLPLLPCCLPPPLPLLFFL